MKPRKIISTDREKAKDGFIKAAEYVGSTYGPGGGNVAIERRYDTTMVTNDGVTVAKHLFLDDEIEDIGASFVRDMTYEADQGSGDGTTTTAVLAKGILEAVWSEVFNHGMQLKNPKLAADDLKKVEDEVITKLDEMKRPIKGLADIINVATVSVESPDIGATIGNMFYTTGEYGDVAVEFDYGFDIITKIIDGFQLDAGMYNHSFSANGQYSTELGFCNVILFDGNMTAQDFNTLLQRLNKEKHSIGSIVILAHGYSEELISTLGWLFKNSTLFSKDKVASMPVVPVVIPTTYREILMRDLSALSGSKIVKNFRDYVHGDAGLSFKKIILKKNKTYFVEPPQDVTEYIADLKKQTEDMTKADKDRMKKRIARIKGSMGIIRVGGQTDAERKYWYHKIKDAVNATRLAIEGGVVLGGGIALRDTNLPGFDEPYKVLCNNLGVNFEANDEIIDPADVVKNSVRKAISAVRQFLMTGVFVAEKRLTVEEEYALEMKQ